MNPGMHDTPIHLFVGMLSLTSLQKLDLSGNDDTIVLQAEEEPTQHYLVRAVFINMVKHKHDRSAFGVFKKYEKLDLSGQSLGDVPEGLFECTSLKSLNLANNSLSVLPKEMLGMTTLTDLQLDDNGPTIVSRNIDEDAQRYLVRVVFINMLKTKAARDAFSIFGKYEELVLCSTPQDFKKFLN